MTVKSLLVKIGADVSEMEAGFKKMDGYIQKNAQKFKTAGRTMTIAGGAILGVMTGTVKAFADFDKAMTESTAIMGDMSDTMRNKMAEAAKDMSEESTFAAKDLAQAYFYLASAGMDAEQSIAALPVVTKFAQAGAFDLARATDLLTDAQSALGLSSKNVAENQENMTRVSDVLVAANTLANASVGQFSEALTNRAGPAMRAYNIDLEEGVAVLAAFADQGVKGGMAGEQFSIVLRDLQKAAIQNKTAFENAGIAVYDANGNLNNMGDIVAQLETRLGSMSAEQKKTELTMLGFQERSQGALLTLVGTSEKIKEYEKNLKSAGGTTEKVAKKQLESLTSQLTLAKNAIVNAAISLGEQLAPTVVEIAEKIKKMVEKIRDWIKEHPELTRGIALTAVKVGALLAVLGPMVMMLPGLVTGFTLLGGAVSVLSGPFGAAALAIVAITVALKDMSKTLRTAKKDMQDLADESVVFANAADNFKTLWITVRQEGGETLKQFNELMERFGGNWDSIMKTIVQDPKFATLKALLLDIANGVKTIDLSAQDLKITLPGALGAGKPPGEELVKTLDKIVETLETKLYPGMRTLGPVTYEVVTKAGEYIRGLKEEIIDLANTFPEKLEPTVLNVFEVIKNAQADLQIHTKEITDIIESTWKEMFDRIADWANFFISGLDSIFYQAYQNNMIRIDNEEKRWLDSINTRYDAAIAAEENLLARQQEITQEKMDDLDAWYEQERQKILDNITDEDEREKALAKLDEKLARKRERLLERRKRKEQKTADALEALEEAKNEALRVASEELERKRSAARRTAAMQEKAVALLNAIVNTAAAVAKALPNIPLAVAVGIMGGIQIALIKAQPIPLAEGGIVMKPTKALIGERGPEAVIPLNKMQPAFAGASIGFKQNIYFYGNISNAGSMDEISERLAKKVQRAIEQGRK